MTAKTVAKTVVAEREYVCGPMKCHQCRAVVRWVRIDGVLVLVNDAGRRRHVCQR